MANNLDPTEAAKKAKVLADAKEARRQAIEAAWKKETHKRMFFAASIGLALGIALVVVTNS